MAMNNSGITPLGARVLIRPVKVEERTAAGVIIAAPTALNREQMAQDRGEVVEVGECAWHDQPKRNWVAPGDMVVFAKYAGNVWRGEDGEQYRLVNDLDIVAKLNGDIRHG